MSDTLDVVKICLIQGEAKTLRFTFVQTINQQSTPVDISGGLITWTVEEDEGVILLQKVPGDFTIVDGPGGIATCQVSASDTDQEPDTYDFETKIQFTGSNIDKHGKGELEIERTLAL